MKRLLPGLMALAAAASVQAANVPMDDQSQIVAKPDADHYFQPPLESELPDNAFGKLVQEGRAIFVDTQKNAAA